MLNIKRRLLSLVTAGILAVGANPAVANAELKQRYVDFLISRKVDPELIAAIWAASGENENGPNSYNDSVRSLMQKAAANGWTDGQVEDYLRGLYNFPTVVVGPRPIADREFVLTGEELKAKIDAFTARFGEAAPAADISVEWDGMAVWTAEPLICKIVVNGVEKAGEYYTQESQILVPADIFAELGCQVSFDAETLAASVTCGDRTVEMIPGLPALHTDDGYAAVTVGPKIFHDKLYVPVRALAESLGIPVRWNGAVVLGNV